MPENGKGCATLFPRKGIETEQGDGHDDRHYDGCATLFPRKGIETVLPSPLLVWVAVLRNPISPKGD